MAKALSDAPTLKWRWADPTAQDHLQSIRDAQGIHRTRDNRMIEDVARGYAWGRIDSVGYRRPDHGGDGLDFSVAYAIHCLSSTRVQALREAFAMWHETGEIV